MSTNWAPLLADLFFFFMWGEIYPKASTWEEKITCCGLQFDITIYWRVLSVNNHFHSCIDSIYPNELEIKALHVVFHTCFYADIVLKLCVNAKLKTPIYDKLDDFNFSIVNFPYLCNNSPSSPVYCVYISQLIRYARACSTHDPFLINSRQSTDKQVNVTGV
jgi:hypothetical protein